MTSNNELLLSVVSKIQDRLIILLNDIGETTDIKDEINILKNYKNDDCGFSKERMEEYKKRIGYKDDESEDTSTDTASPGTIPSLKLSEESIEDYVYNSELSEKGREYFPESVQRTDDVQREDVGQQGGYKVKELFYKKDNTDRGNNSVSVMKKEKEKDSLGKDVEFFKYYTIESEDNIYLHVVKDDQNESELDDDDVKKIMDAGFKDSEGNDINLQEAKSEDGIDRVNKFVIQVMFKDGDKVTSIPVWDSSLITTRSDDISNIFLEKNNKYKSGYFMFYFPFGKIVDSLIDSEPESERTSISQMMREGKDVNSVLNIYITLYGDTPGQKGIGEKILSFNFQVLSEKNPLYDDKYKPEARAKPLEEYLYDNAEVGKSAIHAKSGPLDSEIVYQPEPQQGPDSAEIERLRKKIEEKERERDRILHAPINTAVRVEDGSAPRPELVERERKVMVKPIEDEIERLQAELRTLQKKPTGGGKKKRTYKKKKRRSKKKRTPMKKKIK